MGNAWKAQKEVGELRRKTVKIEEILEEKLINEKGD